MRKYRKGLAMTLALLLLASCFSINGGTTLAAASAQASDYVIIVGPNGLEGDHLGDDPDVPHPGEFKGPSESYPFNLPEDLISTSSGEVTLSAFGVSHGCNRFTINGVQIDGALRKRTSGDSWTIESARIPNTAWRTGSNTLFIEARNSSCEAAGDRDEFAVTNIVIHFRRKPTVSQ
jgi:hypothetical protein